MQGDIVTQGAQLMLYGMGTVLVFLTLLVFATSMMSRLIGEFFPEAEPQPPAPSPVADDAQTIAVITAAVQRYRANRRR